MSFDDDTRVAGGIGHVECGWRPGDGDCFPFLAQFLLPVPHGGTTPPTQNLSVSSIPSTVLFTTSASTTGGGNWLLVSGSAVSVNAAGVGAGTYTGAVTVTPAQGTAVKVPVTLTVQATLTASPSSLNLLINWGLPAQTGHTEHFGR